MSQARLPEYVECPGGQLHIPFSEQRALCGWAWRDMPRHGTTGQAYEKIRHEGLKPMGRNHIHFATRSPEDGKPLSGFRANAEVRIHLDVRKAMTNGLVLWRSANGVLLTSGIDGVIEPRFFLQG